MLTLLTLVLQAPEKATLDWKVKKGEKFTATWTYSSTEEETKKEKSLTVDKREIEMDLVVESESAMSITIRKATLTRETPEFTAKVTLDSETWSPRKKGEAAKHEKAALAVVAEMKQWLKEKYAFGFDPGGFGFWVWVKKGFKIYNPILNATEEMERDGWMSGSVGISVFGSWGASYQPPKPEVKSGDSWKTGRKLLDRKELLMKATISKEAVTLAQSGSDSKSESVLGGKASKSRQEKLDLKIVFSLEGRLQSATRTYEESETTNSSDEFWRGSKKTKTTGSLTLKKG